MHKAIEVLIIIDAVLVGLAGLIYLAGYIVNFRSIGKKGRKP